MNLFRAQGLIRFEPRPIVRTNIQSEKPYRSVLGLWDVVNNLTRLRPSRHEHYRVTICGSARVKAGTFGYEETKRVAAAPERAQSVGIRVDLPFGQEVNAFVTEAFEHRTFFTRLHQCLRRTLSSSRRGASARCWRR